MIGATVLALAAAVLHAGWNLRVKTSDDRFVALWGQLTVSGVCALAGLVLTGLPERATWPYLLVSGAVHLPYTLALARAYGVGDFSLAYPLARGGGALVAALGGLLLLDDQLSWLGWLAIMIVGGGLVSFARPQTSPAAMGWASLVAVLIGTYTLVDAAGARRSEGLAYICAVFVAIAIAVSVWGLLTGQAPAFRRSWTTSGRHHVGSGVAGLLAYGLVLVAVRWAPVGYVTALRESSVVLAALAGWRLLSEDLGRARLASAGVVLSGLVLLVTVR
ncbi:MAG: EamA family transporter [Acidimicrobiales bacterium]